MIKCDNIFVSGKIFSSDNVIINDDISNDCIIRKYEKDIYIDGDLYIYGDIQAVSILAYSNFGRNKIKNKCKVLKNNVKNGYLIIDNNR